MPPSSRLVAVTGLAQLAKNIRTINEQILDQALNAGEDAAAEVYKKALQASAPVGETGDLAKSIIIYESRDRKAVFGGAARRRLLVGPSKKMGFYGFFLEFGTSKMAARPWARAACDAATGEAQTAGREAFMEYLRTHLPRMIQ